MHTDGSDSPQRGILVHVSASEAADAEQLSMTKTVVIAMSCVVAYLGVMAALTVYCLIHMVRARRLRKHDSLQQEERECMRPHADTQSHDLCLGRILPHHIASVSNSQRSAILFVNSTELD